MTPHGFRITTAIIFMILAYPAASNPRISLQPLVFALLDVVFNL